jgi:hypothetical protein
LLFFFGLASRLGLGCGTRGLFGLAASFAFGGGAGFLLEAARLFGFGSSSSLLFLAPPCLCSLALGLSLGSDSGFRHGTVCLRFGLALSLRCGASFYLGAPLGFLSGTSLHLSLCRNAGSGLGASAAGAHHHSDDRGCERKTNPANDKKHLHEQRSSPLSAYGRVSPIAIAVRAPTEIAQGVGGCPRPMTRTPTFGQAAFRVQHAHWGARERHVRRP